MDENGCENVDENVNDSVGVALDDNDVGDVGDVGAILCQVV